MGERKGQNKYYPPDFDYKVHKSLAGYHGEHPLRERAKKMDQGILVIRFEMPYNIWCEGCSAHIGMGVRYNAEKSKIGMYYTTPIYQFRMKCHLCPSYIVIKTDPGNHDYVITEGARRKEQRWDPAENEQIVPDDRATQKKLALDSMYKLEHGVDDVARGKTNQSTIAELVEHQLGHKDDHLLNQLARKQFRDTKKAKLALDQSDDALRTKLSLSIDLLPEHEQDVHMAKLLTYSTLKSNDDRQRAKRQALQERSLFGDAPSDVITRHSGSSSSSGTSSNNSLTPVASGSVAPQRQVCIDRLRQISTADLKRKRAEAFHSSDTQLLLPSVNKDLTSSDDKAHSDAIERTVSSKPSRRDFGIKLKTSPTKYTETVGVDMLDKSRVDTTGQDRHGSLGHEKSMVNNDCSTPGERTGTNISTPCETLSSKSSSAGKMVDAKRLRVSHEPVTDEQVSAVNVGAVCEADIGGEGAGGAIIKERGELSSEQKYNGGGGGALSALISSYDNSSSSSFSDCN